MMRVKIVVIRFRIVGCRPVEQATALDPAAAGEDRILTVPNLITFGRLCCLPIFLYLLFGRDNRAAAGWLLAVLGITDFADGYIARHFDQVSTLGKIIDPVADRLLFFVGISAILVDGSAPLWIGILVLAREAAVSLATLALAARGARRIDVNWFGKAGTFALMMAFPSFLGSHSSLSYADALGVLAWCTAIPGLVLSYLAALMYIPLGRKALAEGRAATP
jgi:cardiolipin synthase